MELFGTGIGGACCTHREYDMKNKLVLVVEDELLVRMMAADILVGAGCSVLEFATAEEAIRFCENPANAMDAVFTDINMPSGRSGLELASIVAATRPGARIVITSGRYARKPDSIADEVRFLPKPWSERALLCSMKDMIEPPR